MSEEFIEKRVKKPEGFIDIDYMTIDWENTAIPTNTNAESQRFVSISTRQYDPNFSYTRYDAGKLQKADGFWMAPAITKSKDGVFDGPVSDWDAWQTSETNAYESEGMHAITVKPKEDTFFIRPSLYKDFLADLIYFCEYEVDKKLTIPEKREFIVNMFRKRYPQFANAKHLVLKIDCLEDIFAYDAIFNPHLVASTYKKFAEKVKGKTYAEIMYMLKQYQVVMVYRDDGRPISDPNLTEQRIEELENLFGKYRNHGEFYQIYKKFVKLRPEEKFQRYMSNLRRSQGDKPELPFLPAGFSFLFGTTERPLGAVDHEFSYFSGLELTKKGCMATRFSELDEEDLRIMSYQKNLSENKTKFNPTHLRNFFDYYDVPSLVIFDGDAIEMERDEIIQYTEEYKRKGYYYDIFDEEFETQQVSIENGQTVISEAQNQINPETKRNPQDDEIDV